MRVTGPRVLAFWGLLLAALLVFDIVGHESLFDHLLWSFAVAVIWSAAFAVWVAERRAPVHRGSFSWPVSASTTLPLAATALFLCLGAVFGIWFAVLAPAPFAVAVSLGLRDRALRRRLVTDGRVRPRGPAHVPHADLLASTPEETSTGQDVGVA